MKEITQSVSLQIKKLRKKKKITQEKLAELSGLSLEYIGRIERKGCNLSIEALEKVANSLEVPIMNLFEIYLIQQDIRNNKSPLIKLLNLLKKEDPDEVEELFKIVKKVMEYKDFKKMALSAN